jgi:hypothetical protein
MTDGERISARFHEVYELLAPGYGYRTREASARTWEKVPEPNRSLMIHTCEFLLHEKCIEVGPSLPESWGSSEG